MMHLPLALKNYPDLACISEGVLAAWPEHQSFLAVRFSDPIEPTLPLAEKMANLILRITGDELPKFIAGYRWVCETLVSEDLHFRRTGRYRWSSFEDVYREVYSRDEYMSNYLRGLLLSQVLWANQAAAFHFYVEQFLARLKPEADFLEIGPGHGLLVYFAARSQQIRSITGWDVSDSSLSMTRHTLETIGINRQFTLSLHNILEPASVFQAYDAVVVSEVLEHLDRPEAALDSVLKALRPGGLAFFNVPTNSPAPDHIYLWDSPAAVEDLVRSRGFSIVSSDAAPTTGYDLDRALRRKVNINSLIIAMRP
jgi:2-polyprenyl-3-methyl-5-hydroxy-6-metoxy-1,4-benzoquinol methylase